jgi:putative membrane protein
MFCEACLVLAVFVCGAVIGILGFSKFLHWLLARWHKETLIVLAGFIIGSLVKVWPWSDTEAIVCSQFSKVAELRDTVENLQDAVAAGQASVTQLTDATVQLSNAVDSHAHLANSHIGWAIIFALLGFFLVTGIELAGKIIAKKSQAQ